MGYDMYLIKVDKTKIRDINNPYDFETAVIDEVNSFYPVLQEFHLENDNVNWYWEEYNIISEQVLLEIIEWLKNKIVKFLKIESMLNISELILMKNNKQRMFMNK